ncbi:hypothetical protein [Paenibacillus sp. UNC451MF]|uniref:hypothetical protein n=1 Tax=Paenibacillus sp. UNC451MF TaxID=1449063 RepID=UPI00048A9619|nr:hypothetical protein [Paenibacillus sp. UNC451MF]
MVLLTDINMIMNYLLNQGILPASSKIMNQMNGTTDGKVFTIGVDDEPKYILKLDEPQQLSLVIHFHETYACCTLLPRLLYKDPAGTYILYSYIHGTTHYHRGLKTDWLPLLVTDLLNHYEPSQNTEAWGRIAHPRHSWREFNERSLEGARQNVQGVLPTEDYDTMKSLIETISETQNKYYLHGDTGVHNFVFHNNTLKGIIDPSPIIGPIMYDFTYAFCSSPDDLTLETLFASIELLQHEPVERSRVIKEVIFQLYTRIGISAKVHPHDLQDYLSAWDYWKKLLPQ